MERSARLLCTRLQLSNVRNIAGLTLEAAPRYNVIAGDNGQGKTSLLEALYLVATSKSFRTERARELIREGQEFARIEATVSESGHDRVQRLLVQGARRSVTCDGQRPESLASYATRTPVVVFHPGDLELTMGAAARRRDLLDRIALFADPSAADDRRRYRLALKERQALLEQRGEGAAEIDAYETLVARHGARLAQSRALASELLAQDALPTFRRLVGAELPFELRYLPGGDLDEAKLRAELAGRRGLDRRRRAATFGPHKDDLGLWLEGRVARRHASQGQHRILTLTLKLAELAAIRAARGAHPILLLDDVSSELDPTRTFAVYAFLRDSQSQVFVTTTRPELFQTPGAGPLERHDYRLVSGALECA